MNWTTEIFLLLCAIPLINTLGLKLDGLLNLGEKWNYEYQILRTDSNEPPNLRAEEEDQDKSMEVPEKKNEEGSQELDLETMLNQEIEKIRREEEKHTDARKNEKHTDGEKDEEINLDEGNQIAGQKNEEIVQDQENEITGQKDDKISQVQEKQIDDQKDKNVAKDQRKRIEDHLDQEIVQVQEKQITGQNDDKVSLYQESQISGQKDEKLIQDQEADFSKQRDREMAQLQEQIARLKDEEAARIQREEEHLSIAENVLRLEADRLRKEAKAPKLAQREGYDRGVLHYIHNPKAKTIETTEARIPKSVTTEAKTKPITKLSKELTTEMAEEITQKSVTPKLSEQKNDTVVRAATSIEDSSNSDKSDESDQPKRGTMMMGDDTTENPKKKLRDATDYSDTYSSSHSRDEDSFYSAETSASFKDRTRQGIERPQADASTSSHTTSDESLDASLAKIIRADNSTTPKAPQRIIQIEAVKVNETILSDENVTLTPLTSTLSTTTPSTTTKVTTVRTGEIFTDAHKVKDDATIADFTTHLYKQTMKIFGSIKEKTNQDHVKAQIDSLMETYQLKFKEFIRKTSEQKIKTRLGTQKVILNTIGTSNRILRRLFNSLVSNLDINGILRDNAGTVSRFQKAIAQQEQLQYSNACKKIGICRSGPEFSSFLVDILNILIKCVDEKLKQAMDAFTEGIKYLDFSYIFEPKTMRNMQLVIARIEREKVKKLRVFLMALKNTIVSMDQPVLVSHYNETNRKNVVVASLAFQEVLDFLDTKIPRNATNVRDWANMKSSLKSFAAKERNDIQVIMGNITRHVTKNLKALDKKGKAIISKNMDLVLSLVTYTNR